MTGIVNNSEFEALQRSFEGNIYTDNSHLLMYATDASAYREKPLAVVYPKSSEDIRKLILFAREKRLTLIPRGAGTSLAGQVVGNGIVVDISKYLNKILEINPDEKWVRVQPGVVLDELNLRLKPYGLLFAPETSTSNRCVIGGMLGNNSSGLHSLIYGTTREHTVSLKTLLSDASEAEFSDLDKSGFEEKCKAETLEGTLYRNIKGLFTESEILRIIDEEYPDKQVVRRNTGYALDELSDCNIFRNSSNKPFNFSRLLVGSEGTLAFITEAKLRVVPLPPPVKALVCVHLKNVSEAVKANLIALKYKPGAVELMDDKIIELTRENIEQRKNRFFIQGNPGAILMVEFSGNSIEEIKETAVRMEDEMRSTGLGSHFPFITGQDITKVWNLRKAGLGVLSNIPGDAKPVSVIEDTSVNPAHLENYLLEMNEMLRKYQLDCVYHAHISVGELHLRPILNLKNEKDLKLFRSVAEDTARMVKKYKGSLSGEHGDGRLRGEFIPIILGEKIYHELKNIKHTWDPYNIFNYGKIVDTCPMDTHLRYSPGKIEKKIQTFFNFDKEGGILKAVEKCNGSGDCRKSELMGGTMCPSFMATHDENSTTRARANLLREFLTNSEKKNSFDHHELYQILDLCISCKGCKSECPSNIDMAKFKAEFLQHYYDSNGIPLRSRLVAYISYINKIGSLFPALYNFFVSNPLLSRWIKKVIGFSEKRRIPKLYRLTLKKWAARNVPLLNSALPASASGVIVFIDEFTNYNDTEIGIRAIRLLSELSYRIEIAPVFLSGRTHISKGLVRTAKKIAIKNIRKLTGKVKSDLPLIGIEPSAILAFRDEYPELVNKEIVNDALNIAENTFVIDEFLAKEMDSGRIKKEQFTRENKRIRYHGHCQQKSIASIQPTLKILSFPENYEVFEIKSGCCGMAGSFGYEKEHYDVSMKIGELVLFKEIRNTERDTIISASGTSCREQIKDGTGIIARHPAEILYEALLKPRA